MPEMPSLEETISQKVKRLPKDPGVYKFFGSEDKIIYIGKAKNLKNRVSSYFNKSNQHNRKTKKLVSEIRNLEYVVVNSEFDALLLENNLIKAHQPKYNILLKDDKTYPYICVTNEPFPRVFSTRKLDNKNKFFGPYASVRTMNTVLELLRKLYTIRTCTFYMDAESIKEEKHKICLEYHIKNCQGPCEGLQSRQDYQSDIDQVIHILKGNLKIVKQHFKAGMQKAAEDLDFEKAQLLKNKLERLENYQAKSLITNPNTAADVDCFTIISDESHAYVNFLKIINGSITQTQSIEIKKKLEEADEEILSYAILELREKFNSQAPRIITNIPINLDLGNTETHFPKIGDLKKIVDLSVKNLMFFKKERMTTKVEVQANKSKNYTLLQLKADLNLPDLPRHIECFDNSNIQGTNPVAAMVCFKDGKPSKKDYRKYHIKTVIGPDDFKSMNEIVHRRYSRVMDEGSKFPNLIVIDGGKGQLNAACEALKGLGIYGKIPIVGIAKRLEEIYYPEDQIPIHISKKSRSLALLQQVRDEAHRFAITFHRDTRSATSLTSELDRINGIGKKTVERLLLKFKTVNKIKGADFTELSTEVGNAKAKIVFQHFNKKRGD